jgi:hypothetical protein
MDTSYINKVQKAKDYAADPERVTFHTLALEFRGDNNNYNVSLGPDGWSCSCPGFSSYGICPHIMALEKRFKPMLKRTPQPYAAGQNIVSDVKKAHRYADETERMRITQFVASVRGDNKEHTVTYDHGNWTSTSSYFKSHGICAYTMALERILKGLIEPVKVTHMPPTVETE